MRKLLADPGTGLIGMDREYDTQSCGGAERRKNAIEKHNPSEFSSTAEHLRPAAFD
jgi:hypothetical protein